MAFVAAPSLAPRGRAMAPAPPRLCRHRPAARPQMAASAAGPTPPSGGDAVNVPAAATAALADLVSPHLPTRRRALVALLVHPPPARALLASPALTSPDEGVRLAAVSALGRTTDDADAVAAALLSVLASDGEAGVRAAAAGSLGGVDPPAAADDDAAAAAAAAPTGGAMAADGEGGPGLTPAVRAGLRAAAAAGGGDPNFMVRYSALVSLGTGRAVDDVPFLLSVLGGCAKADANDQLVAQGAVMALSEMRVARRAAGGGGGDDAAATDWVPDAVAALAGWAAVPDGLTRMAVARALGVAATSWGAAAVAGGVLNRMVEGEGLDVRAVVGGVLERVAAARRAAEGDA